jgi:hypothetical protein
MRYVLNTQFATDRPVPVRPETITPTKPDTQNTPGKESEEDQAQMDPPGFSEDPPNQGKKDNAYV